MTHTSTERPEALRLAVVARKRKRLFIDAIANEFEDIACELERLHARVQELETVHAAISDLDGNDVIRISGVVGISVHHDDGYPDHDRLQQLIDFVRIAAHGIKQEKQG